jgi:hypothetical protein
MPTTRPVMLHGMSCPSNPTHHVHEGYGLLEHLRLLLGQRAGEVRGQGLVEHSAAAWQANIGASSKPIA